MGMTDSGAAFQKAIEKVLTGIPGVEQYMDDILIRGPTHAVHDEWVRRALKCLEDNNFRLKK